MSSRLICPACTATRFAETLRVWVRGMGEIVMCMHVADETTRLTNLVKMVPRSKERRNTVAP